MKLKEGMTIVDGIKKLKIIKKRMVSNAGLITKYSSQCIREKPLFGTVEAQEKEVAKLVQANEDLAKEYQDINRALIFTNINTEVTIESHTGSINDFILFKRELHKLLRQTMNGMNDDNYRIHRPINNSNQGDTQIQRYYSEAAKQEKLRKIDDLYNEIDSRLENINATTLLLNPDEYTIQKKS